MVHVAAVEPPLPEDQAVRIEIPIELRAEDQAPVEAPLLKDLIDLWAEDNATAAGTPKVYRRATSGAIKVFTSSVNIPGTRFEFDKLFGCRLAIPEVDPINAEKTLRALMTFGLLRTLSPPSKSTSRRLRSPTYRPTLHVPSTSTPTG